MCSSHAARVDVQVIVRLIAVSFVGMVAFSGFEATFALLTLVLLVTLGNLLLGFGTAVYFGHGPKWFMAAVLNFGKERLFAKRAQKSPQSPH